MPPSAVAPNSADLACAADQNGGFACSQMLRLSGRDQPAVVGQWLLAAQPALERSLPLTFMPEVSATMITGGRLPGRRPR